MAVVLSADCIGKKDLAGGCEKFLIWRLTRGTGRDHPVEATRGGTWNLKAGGSIRRRALMGGR
jgi:hypothetical protein